MIRRSAISRVGEAACRRAPRPRASRSVSSSRPLPPGAAGAAPVGEGLHHAPRHATATAATRPRPRPASARSDVGRVGVLEQEAARARAQRLEDVLVDLEGGQDHDLDAGQLRARPTIRRVASQPVDVGHADVHEHDVGPLRARRARPPRRRRRPPRRPRGRPRPRAARAARRAAAPGRRRAATRIIAGPPGSEAQTRKPPLGAPAGLEAPAERGGALAHPGRARRRARTGARRAAAVVAHLDLDHAVAAREAHARAGVGARVARHVGQRLLDDAIAGGGHDLGHGRRRPRHRPRSATSMPASRRPSTRRGSARRSGAGARSPALRPRPRRAARPAARRARPASPWTPAGSPAARRGPRPGRGRPGGRRRRRAA